MENYKISASMESDRLTRYSRTQRKHKNPIKTIRRVREDYFSWVSPTSGSNKSRRKRRTVYPKNVNKIYMWNQKALRLRSSSGEQKSPYLPPSHQLQKIVVSDQLRNWSPIERLKWIQYLFRHESTTERWYTMNAMINSNFTNPTDRKS